MANQSKSTSAEIITAFRGVYARVAAKLGVDASLVSKVANGKRQSADIQKALRQELIALKSRLESFPGS
jgi:predicted XRE-type DNA-binding protein